MNVNKSTTELLIQEILEKHCGGRQDTRFVANIPAEALRNVIALMQVQATDALADAIRELPIND